MRLVNVNGEAGLLIEGMVFPASVLAGFPVDPMQAIEVLSDFELPAALRGGMPVEDVMLEAPVPRPQKVIGAGLNYKSHAAELALAVPSEPMLFLRLSSAIAGPFADLLLPVGSIDWEAELVVVIGRRGKHIRADDAWAYVAGLTCGQDISHRDEQDKGGQWMSIAKSYDTFAPIGPAVVTVDEFQEPNDLQMTCQLNGKEVQSSRTSDMVFNVPELVAYLSGICTLEPGDLIFTGTPPGVGSGRTPPRYLAPGDVVETQIESIGSMRNRCVSESG